MVLIGIDPYPSESDHTQQPKIVPAENVISGAQNQPDEDQNFGTTEPFESHGIVVMRIRTSAQN